jgi:signal peptidase I
VVYDSFDPVAAAPPTVLDDLPPPAVGPDAVVRPRRDPESDDGMSHRSRWLLEWLLVIVVAAGVAIGMRTYVVGTYFIPSASMEPTLMIGDRILVNKLSYHYHSIERGDIVVFGRPPDEAPSNIKDLVKRVIGLPGETIKSGPNGQILIDGSPIAQPWLTAGARLSPGPPITASTVGCHRGADDSCLIPPGEYFMMGDNRGNSEDSRYFGPISGSLIVGHVILRFWPLGSFHVF